MNKYSKIIMEQKWWLSIPILLLSALCYSLAIGIFASSAKLFPKGMSAYVQLIMYIFNLQLRWFSVMLLGINIPLFFIFWKHLGKKFIIYTICWLIFQFMWSQLIFSFKVDVNPFVFETANNELIASGRIIYGIIAAIFVGIAVGFAFLAGGSSGGIDFFVYFYYLRKRKSVGFYSMVFGFFTVFSSIIIQFLLRKSVETSVYYLFLGATTFITIIYILVYTMLLSVIYPRHKKVKVEISSKLSDKIVDYLIESKFHHGYSVREERSVYSKRNIQMITTVISYMEIYSFIKRIRQVDPKAWMSITYVQHVFGAFNNNLIKK